MKYLLTVLSILFISRVALACVRCPASPPAPAPAPTPPAPAPAPLVRDLKNVNFLGFESDKLQNDEGN